MSPKFTCPVLKATELFDRLKATLSVPLVDPAQAQPGDICGFQVSTKSESGKNGYALSFPIDEFLVKNEQGDIVLTHFSQLDAQTQPKAAMIAVQANLIGPARIDAVRHALDQLDDDYEAFYASLIVLPNLALLYQEQYADSMDVDFGYPDDLQEEIDRYFMALTREPASNHEALILRSLEQRDLDILCSIAPIAEDYSDASAPHVALILDQVG